MGSFAIPNWIGFSSSSIKPNGLAHHQVSKLKVVILQTDKCSFSEMRH